MSLTNKKQNGLTIDFLEGDSEYEVKYSGDSEGLSFTQGYPLPKGALQHNIISL